MKKLNEIIEMPAYKKGKAIHQGVNRLQKCTLKEFIDAILGQYMEHGCLTLGNMAVNSLKEPNDTGRPALSYTRGHLDCMAPQFQENFDKQICAINVWRSGNNVDYCVEVVGVPYVRCGIVEGVDGVERLEIFGTYGISQDTDDIFEEIKRKIGLQR